MRHDEEVLILKGDLDRRFAEEQREVPHLDLHRQESRLLEVLLPRLVLVLRRRQRCPRAERDDVPALDVFLLDDARRQNEADLGALLGGVRLDQHAVADD